MNNAFINKDPISPDPCVWIVTNPINIFRNDQEINWKIIGSVDLVNWAPDMESPIQFGPEWRGGTPHRVTHPGAQDWVQVTGPGPAGTNPENDAYTAFITVTGCGAVIPIKGFVINQPR